jgi:hypothetical protein
MFMQVQAAMYHDQWLTCVVCDERTPSVSLPGERTTHHFVAPAALPNKHVLEVPPDHVDNLLIDQYNISLKSDDYAFDFTDQDAKALACLASLALSPRGVVKKPSGEPAAAGPDGGSSYSAPGCLERCVCTLCFTSLKKNS